MLTLHGQTLVIGMRMSRSMKAICYALSTCQSVADMLDGGGELGQMLPGGCVVDHYLLCSSPHFSSLALKYIEIFFTSIDNGETSKLLRLYFGARWRGPSATPKGTPLDHSERNRPGTYASDGDISRSLGL
jgi:hypothetical protein